MNHFEICILLSTLIYFTNQNIFYSFPCPCSAAAVTTNYAQSYNTTTDLYQSHSSTHMHHICHSPIMNLIPMTGLTIECVIYTSHILHLPNIPTVLTACICTQSSGQSHQTQQNQHSYYIVIQQLQTFHDT